MPYANIEDRRACEARYRAAHPDRMKAKAAAFRAANRERLRAYGAAYRAAHPQERRARVQSWEARHRKERRAYQAERYVAFPELKKAHNRRRRALKVGNGVYVISAKDLRRLERGPCTYCGGAVILQVDHVIPLSRGGRHAIGNLVAACKSCNYRKNARLLADWRLRP